MNRYTCDECGGWLKDDEETTCRECLQQQDDIEIYVASLPETVDRPSHSELVEIFMARKLLGAADDDS